MPRTDTFIDKEASINEEIDMMRHSATQSLLSRDDVIVVSSVSCIYGIGSPEDYGEFAFGIAVGDIYERSEILSRLVFMQYERNDIEFDRGQFRVRGDVIEINPVHGTPPIRVELFGDEIDAISIIDKITGKKLENLPRYMIYPAKHFVVGQDKMDVAIRDISQELDERLNELNLANKLVEAQRLEQRTRFDIEMLLEMGYCPGIENYSMHLSGRKWGEKPYSLLKYFPDDFLTIIDESHVTIPQIRGMYNGDRARKETLVEYGFRLPSAKENRPLRFDEFESSVQDVIYVSATPGPYELAKSRNVVEQIIRPTGLVDPEVIIRPVEGQVEDLLSEVRKISKDERVLVTTLTKRMAEDLTDYYARIGVKVRYMHSEIDTLERIEIVDDLRRGTFDVLVGVNLLREGLDLPEVSLVAILDADKEGFLRNQTSLIQTIGRAARNVNGRVIMYVDDMTDSVKNAYDITLKRRRLQMKYNEEHGITPKSTKRTLKEKTSENTKYDGAISDVSKIPKDELKLLITDLEQDMKDAASRLDFERAADLRNKLFALRGMDKE